MKYPLKTLAILCLSSVISSCDLFSSSGIKSVVDLTTPLSQENTRPIIFKDATPEVLEDKHKVYTLSKSELISRPAVSKKIFYSVDVDGFVTAFSLKENKILWRTDIKTNKYDKYFTSGGIKHSNGKLYVTNGSRHLVVVDAATGIEEFRKEFSDIIRVEPVVTANNDIIIQTGDNKTYSIRSNDFGINWVHEGGDQNINISSLVKPTIFRTNLIVSYTNGNIFSIDLKTGDAKWLHRLTSIEGIESPDFVPSSIQTQPIVVGEVMYFATSNGKLIKFNLENGTTIWSREAYDVQSLAMHEGYLILTNNARQVAVIDSHSSKVLWVGELNSKEGKAQKRRKPAKFTEAFVTKYNDTFSINVVSNNGELYKFTSGYDIMNNQEAAEKAKGDISSSNSNNNSGYFPEWPIVQSIQKGALYNWFCCCSGEHYLIGKDYIAK